MVWRLQWLRLRRRRRLRRSGIGLGRRLRGRRRHRGWRELNVGLGGLGRHVHLILPDLAAARGGNLVAGPLIWNHLRQGLRRIRLLVLGRPQRGLRRRGPILRLIGLLIIGLRRRRVHRRLLRAVHRPQLRWRDRRRLRCHVLRLRYWRRLRRRCRRLRRSGHRWLRRNRQGRLRWRSNARSGRRNAIIHESGLGRTAFHAELVAGRGMVPAVGAEHRDENVGW